MAVIITMSGLGNRFINEGFKVPKFMITSRGKFLFEWSLLSLKEFYDQLFVFACLEEHDSNWIKMQVLKLGIENFIIVTRDQLSRGQAHTAYDVMYCIPDNEEVWVYNIDTYVEIGLNPSEMYNFAGCVPVFESNNPGMSFVKLNKNNLVVRIKEKELISNLATVGLYGFENKNIFIECYLSTYYNKKGKNEEYIAPIYQHLLKLNERISAPILNNNYVYLLGTPAEVLVFDKNTLPPYGARRD